MLIYIYIKYRVRVNTKFTMGLPRTKYIGLDHGKKLPIKVVITDTLTPCLLLPGIFMITDSTVFFLMEAFPSSLDF